MEKASPMRGRRISSDARWIVPATGGGVTGTFTPSLAAFAGACAASEGAWLGHHILV